MIGLNLIDLDLDRSLILCLIIGIYSSSQSSRIEVDMWKSDERLHQPSSWPTPFDCSATAFAYKSCLSGSAGGIIIPSSSWETTHFIAHLTLLTNGSSPVSLRVDAGLARASKREIAHARLLTTLAKLTSSTLPSCFSRSLNIRSNYPSYDG